MKRFLIALFSIVCLLGLVAILSATVFKEELTEWAIKQKMKKYDQLKMYYVAEIPVEPENFAEDFKSIHEQVLEECSLYKQKGINMDSLYTTFAKRIGNEVQTKADYGLLVCEYIAALNIGHANAHLDVYWSMYSPTIVEGRLFIDTPNEYMTNYGFLDKDEVIAINNIPIKQYIDSRKKYTNASTEDARMHLTLRWALRSHTDSLIVCDVLRGSDTLKLDLPLTKGFPTGNKDELVAKGKVLNDSVGYISVESMMGNAVEDFIQAYQQVCELPYLIIDIRNNGGGNSIDGRLIAEYLVRNPQQHCLGGDIVPQSNSYKGKLFLLTSNFTFSAAESFAIDMKESGNATLVGETTAGDTGNGPDFFVSEYGIYFRVPTREPRVSPQGFPLEGVGVEPHYKVEQTVKDFFDNKDTIIEYVLNELINNK